MYVCSGNEVERQGQTFKPQKQRMHELGDKSSCMSDINVNKLVNNCPHLFGAEAAEVIEICMHQE